MRGDPSQRNQNLYCTYHKDKGHTTEQCRVLKDHLRQLVKVGHLKEFVVNPSDRGTGQGAQQRGNPLPPLLGVIKVIHATPRGMTVTKKGVLTVVPVEELPEKRPPEKKVKLARKTLAFDEDNLEGTIQPHDNALVVMVSVSSFLVKRVMIDQGNRADIMYPDLFKRLGLMKQDLSKYNTLLVGFDGRVVIPEGQIFLPVNMEGKEVTVTFVVVNSFSPYTAILGKPWIHAMGAIPSTLHVKVKFPTEHGIAVVNGNQQVARQCLVAAVGWKNKQNSREGTEASCAEELIRVKILSNSNRYFQVGASMEDKDKSPYEVPGVDPEFIVRKLNIDPSFPPKKQRPRRSTEEHVKAVRQEV
ncbi:uncharacterized protein LOC111998674 [Quercus suber]|uniref:uncharacterized protein LOC111998674 n=1 Tax=Quercus suber TaxID=58331 RepID=UPI000CE1B006|nr:uncharacterized protein LOC111998674 [Quercus suber]